MYSSAVAEAVVKAVKRCVFIIIPSLFAFMTVSRIMIRTGALDFLLRPVDKVLNRLFGIPAGFLTLFILSNIGGYPVGASIISELIKDKRVDDRSAQAMLVCCFAGGPAYIINAVGLAVYHSKTVGTVLFLSVLSANAVLSIILLICLRPIIKPTVTEGQSVGSTLTECVCESGEGLFSMCKVIVFFSAVIAVLEGFGVFDFICRVFSLSKPGKVILLSILEITSLSEMPAAALGYLPYASCVLGFGGVCVILQLRTFIDSKFFKLFLAAVPLRALLDFAFSKLYIWLFLGDSVPTYVQNNDLIVDFNNLLPSICLIMMIFITVLQKRLDFFREV